MADGKDTVMNDYHAFRQSAENCQQLADLLPKSTLGVSHSGANVADGADLNAKVLGLLTDA